MIELLLPLGAYALGSISSAIVVAQLFRLGDPRNTGSGNPGATNILRYGGKRAAIMTLAGDVLKGVIAVLVARLLTDDARIIAAVMFGAFIGHLYPVFFSFKGGKGVATAFGVYISALPVVGLAFAASWIMTALISRMSSLSALVATAMTPAYIWFFTHNPFYVAASVVIGALLFWRHRTNIRRILSGDEPRIGQKANAS